MSNSWHAKEEEFFVIAEVISLFVNLNLTYVPITAKMFESSPLSLADLALSIGIISGGFLVLPNGFIGRKIWTRGYEWC